MQTEENSCLNKHIYFICFSLIELTPSPCQRSMLAAQLTSIKQLISARYESLLHLIESRRSGTSTNFSQQKHSETNSSLNSESNHGLAAKLTGR